MPKRPEQTIAYRIYHKGSDFLGVATIELPQVQQMTETISGSGIAGEIENPTIGITQPMSCKLSFTSMTSEAFKALNWTETALWECYAAVQVTDDATSVRDSVAYQINFLGRAKSFPLGSLEQGKKHGNEIEMELTRLEVLLEGEEKLLIDKLAFIYRVEGNDLLRQVRAQTGLNV